MEALSDHWWNRYIITTIYLAIAKLYTLYWTEEDIITILLICHSVLPKWHYLEFKILWMHVKCCSNMFCLFYYLDEHVSADANQIYPYCLRIQYNIFLTSVVDGSIESFCYFVYRKEGIHWQEKEYFLS